MGRVAVFFTLLLIVQTVSAAGKTKRASKDSWRKTTTAQLTQLTKTLNKLANDKGVDLVPMADDYFMVFRIQYGIGKSAYDKFMDVGENDDDDAFVRSKLPCGCRTTDIHLPCDRHYRSRILDLWKRLPIERVRVGVYKDNVEQRFWEFNGTGTDSENWFSQEKLLENSYSDLSSTSGGTNFFSIRGDTTYQRRFFINKNYGGCHVDRGWLVVAEKLPPPCSWEGTRATPNILYSKTSHSANWNSAEDVSVADVLVVSVKFKAEDNSTCPAI